MKTACVDSNPEVLIPGCREVARGAVDAAPGDLAEPQVCAPILLLGFNRPDLLRGLVGILAKVQPPKLYLAVDGPRPGREGEATACAECAAVLDHLDWPCQVEKLVRTENLGCRLAVTGAIDWFFSKEEEGIILEDDCWPDPSFLRFATELLERYRNDERVGMVCGNNPFQAISSKTDSYNFMMIRSIWGWATWRRVWVKYDGDPEHWRHELPGLLKEVYLTRQGRNLQTIYLRGLLKNNNTWDLQLQWVFLRERLLSIHPRRNLVRNMGFIPGTAGTHIAGYCYGWDNALSVWSIAFPLVHPDTVERDFAADRLHERRAWAILPRALTIIGLKGGKLGRTLAECAHPIEKALPWLFRIG